MIDLLVLDLEAVRTTMGVSETRATSGALFVELGAGALLLGTPAAFAMIGFARGGGAAGRITSTLVDPAPTRQTWIFFAAAAAVAVVAVAINRI